eukprot:COSAG02_NODE_15929_length_1128_cov_3.821186_1_plen_58_part_00
MPYVSTGAGNLLNSTGADRTPDQQSMHVWESTGSESLILTSESTAWYTVYRRVEKYE